MRVKCERILPGLVRVWRQLKVIVEGDGATAFTGVDDGDAAVTARGGGRRCVISRSVTERYRRQQSHLTGHVRRPRTTSTYWNLVDTGRRRATSGHRRRAASGHRLVSCRTGRLMTRQVRRRETRSAS